MVMNSEQHCVEDKAALVAFALVVVTQGELVQDSCCCMQLVLVGHDVEMRDLPYSL